MLIAISYSRPIARGTALGETLPEVAYEPLEADRDGRAPAR